MAVTQSNDIPSNAKLGEIDLSGWIGDQRTAQRKGSLSKPRYDLLNEIGFSFNTHVDAWKACYDLLCEYKAEYGTANMPKRTIYKSKKLGLWCERQRTLKTSPQRTLTTERIDLLDALDFDWNPLESEWTRRFEQYKRYIKEHDGNKRYQNLISSVAFQYRLP